MSTAKALGHAALLLSACGGGADSPGTGSDDGTPRLPVTSTVAGELRPAGKDAALPITAFHKRVRITGLRDPLLAALQLGGSVELPWLQRTDIADNGV